jgi:putative membrane protein
VQYPADEGLVRVLRQFSLEPGAVLGRGGEAWVYALDDQRVLRVLHHGGRPEAMSHSARLVEELAQANPPFALPQVLDIGEVEGRWYSIERRLPGVTVSQQLERVTGRKRAALIEAYLTCSARLGDLHLDGRPFWGDLLAQPPVRSASWHGFLVDKAARSLADAGPQFAQVDPLRLADELPDPERQSFVHLDAFAGNVLADNEKITAVIDIGATAVAGDRRLDPLASAIYLTPLITPTADEHDRDVARSWLQAAGLGDWHDAAERWLAAYWSSAVDDARLHAWCKSVLVRP